MKLAIFLALASIAAAAPAPAPVESSSQVRFRHRTVPHKVIKNEQYDLNWAGVIINDQPSGTFRTVSATVTVPTPSSTGGSNAQAGSAWVGIDGASCTNAILQTGFDWQVNPVAFDAWYEWYPAGSVSFSGININPGDAVVLTVVATSPTSGSAQITNQNTGQTVNHQFSGQPALCGADAEWIVEDYEVGNGLVPFANFTPVYFHNAAAYSPQNVYYPSQGSLIDIQQNGQTLTKSYQISSETVHVHHT